MVAAKKAAAKKNKPAPPEVIRVEKTWKLYYAQACNTAGLYNELYPNHKESK